jgi:hypothetical protein
LHTDYNEIKLEFSNKRNSRKFSSTWRLNNTLLHDQWDIDVTREEIKRFLEYITNTERLQINDLMLHLKLLEIQQTKPKTRRREIIKIRAKINEIETKENIQRINKTKLGSLKR